MTRFNSYLKLMALLGGAFLISSSALARAQIRIVGSTAAYPFATAVAEHYGRITAHKTPVVEATGTGGGINIFCSGAGVKYPDMVTASRAMSEQERKRCKENGVTHVAEIVMGYDGIVVGMRRHQHAMGLTRAQLYQALADRGSETPKVWRDIDPSFPNKRVQVLGPPPSSGTREAFEHLVIQGGCRKYLGNDHKACRQPPLREDGGFVEVGDQENVVVQKLEINPQAIGIFSFSFLEQNRDRVQPICIEGICPTFQTIARGHYPISRPLYLYVKVSRRKHTPGVQEFVQAFISEAASGDLGYLARKGLIPMPKHLRSQQREKVREAFQKLQE